MKSLITSIFPVFLGVFLIFSTSCKSTKESSSNEESSFPKVEFNDDITWVHSHEEDKDGNQYYRHEPFEFPPSRGREGFKLLNETELVFYAIGPTDFPAELEGTWTYTQDILRFNVIGGQGVKSFERAYKVIEGKPDLIVMKLQ